MVHIYSTNYHTHLANRSIDETLDTLTWIMYTAHNKHQTGDAETPLLLLPVILLYIPNSQLFQSLKCLWKFPNGPTWGCAGEKQRHIQYMLLHTVPPSLLRRYT